MNLALLIEYEGTHYAGWQNQPNGRSVQSVIEEAVSTAFGTTVPVIGSGRTDAGVHARGQVAHVQLHADAHAIPIHKVPIALNTRLPRDVRIRAAAEVDPDFHARYGAQRREYVYRIAKQFSVFTRAFAWTPDLPYSSEVLADALTVFEGTHDFTAISKHNPDTRSYTCAVEHCRLEDHNEDLVIRIRADRFVYGMCRAIVGTAMSVARGKISRTQALDLLGAATRNGQAPLAPPDGLILNRVRYTNGIFDDHPSF
jgi:tRNA pseudouridine38-40 synthase